MVVTSKRFTGKSEFIITWILSLAINYSPKDAAFLLIDYKGGGLLSSEVDSSCTKLTAVDMLDAQYKMVLQSDLAIRKISL